jgi:hypothetical protein
MIHVLPRSLVPLPDESLPGLLLRLAYRLGVSPGRVAQLCGLASQGDRVSAKNLLCLPASAVFATAARLSQSEADGLTLSRYAAAYPPAARVAAPVHGSSYSHHRSSWVFNSSTRYCPQCLAGDGSAVQDSLGGSWKLSWHLPVVFACTVHQRLLDSYCPSCALPLGGATDGRGSLVRSPLSKNLHPLQCRNFISKRGSGEPLCGTHLDAPQEVSRPFSQHDLSLMLSLQERLNRRLGENSTRFNSGCADTFFPDLILVSKLIKLGWPTAADVLPSDGIRALIDSHASPIVQAIEKRKSGNGPSVLDGWSAPQDSAQCAALLIAAVSLIDMPDPAYLRSRIQPLVIAAFNRHSQRTREAIQQTAPSRPLARALVRRVRIFTPPASVSRPACAFHLATALTARRRFHRYFRRNGSARTVLVKLARRSTT